MLTIITLLLIALEFYINLSVANIKVIQLEFI
jgi:hypothetical protein